MRNGETVAAFERAFGEYVGARYAIALCNGTATLHTALLALGVQPGDKVAVPPLTMSATAIAVLQAAAIPVFTDVTKATWLMKFGMDGLGNDIRYAIPVSLYGLSRPWQPKGCQIIDDAAQTLRQHDPAAAFTSYSFQASKILALGEGGMLVTNDEELATRARSFSSLGYEMRADQPRIDPKVLKSPTFARHHRLGWNYRMNDLTAWEGLRQLDHTYPAGAPVTVALEGRRVAAEMYQQAIADCDWLTPQRIPEGWTFDAWTYAFAVKSVDLWHPLAEAMVRRGAEMPYACWRITYQEPAFRHLAQDGTCPVAEDLQPRLVQCQTNNIQSAERNATALRLAIQDVERSRSW